MIDRLKMNAVMYFKVVILISLTLVSLVNGDEYSGICGDGLAWELSNGILTIFGTGNMTYFGEFKTPWHDYRKSIYEIVINDGVRTISSYAFEQFPKITKMTLPQTLLTIGVAAFFGCKNLTSINIPEHVSWIGQQAFDACTSLTRIQIPESVE